LEKTPELSYTLPASITEAMTTLVGIEKLMRQTEKTLNEYHGIELPNSSEIKELRN
jgi:hypothetical protein